MLDQVAAIAERERVDAVLVSGDLLDRRLIDPAALGACLRALERLAHTAPVLVVAGNHDDPDLWTHLAPHLAGSGIHVAGRVRPPAEGVRSVATAAGPLHAALVPWLEPARMALEAGASVQDARGRYADRVAAVLEAHAREAVARRGREGGVAVLVGHVMVERASAGGGERELTMGMTYVVSSQAVPGDLDYVALGHVHRPQPVPGLSAPGRYAGSPMALDFGDEAIVPSVVVVEVGGRAAPPVVVPLDAARPLARITGRLGDLATRAAAFPEAWLACDVELDGPVVDLVRRVREEVPRALRVRPVYPAVEDGPAAADVADDAEAALADHYAAWMRAQGREPERAIAAAFSRALAAADDDAAVDDGEEG